MSFSFGSLLKMHIFGESHGECIGVLVEGLPAGLKLDLKKIQFELNLRKPGQKNSSPRQELDEVEFLSGLFNGKTTGAPILTLVKNSDKRSMDYSKLASLPRPGHADLTSFKKFHGFNDFRGGGIFSGRLTCALVIAGAIAKQLVKRNRISVNSKILSVGARKNFPSLKEINEEIESAVSKGDSVGGVIECCVEGLPVGLGEPFFDSMESVLSHAMFSIPGVKGIEFGSGFCAAEIRGSQNNDAIVLNDGKVSFASNNAGGILGGLSNGMPVVFRLALKPTPSISRRQKTVDLVSLSEKEISVQGRHDPCIVLRALPVVECLAAFCIADFLLRGGFIERVVK